MGAWRRIAVVGGLVAAPAVACVLDIPNVVSDASTDAKVLAPFITGFVDGERAPGEADESIRGIAHALCVERATGDIKELVAFFDKRRADHPAERYARMVTESSTCR